MTPMKTIVVLPTYNERENIGALLNAILEQDLPDLAVLVVDDSSPDGTGAVVTDFSQRDARVSLLTRAEKKGLGRAYIAGFHEAMRRGAEAVVQMDADFSHDPHDIPRLLFALDRVDFVVGSRYLHGGRVRDWALHRRWLSRTANIYARIVTGAPVTDLTGGFAAIRTTILHKIALDSITAEGYGFQIEMKVRAWRQHARIEEIPIVFEDRREGQSKMSHHIILEAMWLVWKLRFQR